MKRTINVIVFFAILLTAISARTERLFMAQEGHYAPELILSPCDSSNVAYSLADLKGKFVLLNFWATTDAESRIAAKNYDDLFSSSLKGVKVRHVAVNIDHSDRLFREIMRRDGLDATTQHRANYDISFRQVVNDWHLENGLRSFLIDPKGTIIAVNPSVETLTAINNS